MYFFVVFFFVVGVRGWFFVKEVPQAITEYWETIEADIPEFSVEKTSEGLLFSNIEQPYIYTFEEDGESVLVYIDTVSTSSVQVDDVLGEDTERYTVIMTSQKLKLYDYKSGRTEIENIRQLPDFSFTKSEIGDELKTFAVNIFPGVFFVGVVFLTVVLGIGKLIHLLILSWLVYVLARADKKPWKWKHVYTIGLYAITIATILQWLLTFFYTSIPYVYSIFSLFIMYMVVYRGLGDKKNNSPDQPSISEPPKQ